MKVNQIDMGTPQVYRAWTTGQIAGEGHIEGALTYVYPRGTKVRRYTIKVPMLKGDAPASGGAAAFTQLANENRARQLEELVGNYYQMPVYIQMYAGGTVTPVQYPQDGWYVIDDLKTDYTNTFFGVIEVTMSVAYVSSGVQRSRTALWYGGGLTASASLFGNGTPWLAFPIGSTGINFATARIGAEGSIPWSNSLSGLDPYYFTLSTSIANYFLGGLHVFDTISLGGNAVPGAGFLNVNWLEVFGQDHLFSGDKIVTNGLLMMRIQVGANSIPTYFWNNPNWVAGPTIIFNDNSSNVSTVASFALIKLSMEDTYWYVMFTTTGGNEAIWKMRLQRGAYFPRLEFQDLTQSNTNGASVMLSYGTNVKINYNSIGTTDNVLSGGNLGPPTDYGYSAMIVANSSFPFLSGFLYQERAPSMPSSVSAQTIGVGDTALPVVLNSIVYGVFLVPYATPQNLQAEAEGGALSGGFVAVTDAGKSASPSDGANNAAKIPNTTVVGAIDLFGTAWQPAAGSYIISFRLRATNANNATANFQFGWWDTTNSSWIQSRTIASNVLTTAYAWYDVGGAVVAPAGHNVQFRAINTGTSADDFFVDQAVAKPTTLVSLNGPQDMFQQFLHDRTVRLAVV